MPWWWDETRITKDQDELKRQFEAVLGQQDFLDESIEIAVTAPLEKFEELLQKKLPDGRRKKLLEILGPDHRLVLMKVEKGERKGEGVLAVRIREGQAKVAGIVKL